MRACDVLTREIYEALRAEGLSQTQIGRRLGITKNVVSGWAGRQGYGTPGLSVMNRGNGKPRKARLRPLLPGQAPPEAPGKQGGPKVPPVRYSPGGQARGCQYIAGKPSHDDACKCLAAILPGKPYCEKHWRLCNFMPKPPKSMGTPAYRWMG